MYNFDTYRFWIHLPNFQLPYTDSISVTVYRLYYVEYSLLKCTFAQPSWLSMVWGSEFFYMEHWIVNIKCPKRSYHVSSESIVSLCTLYHYYEWKMAEDKVSGELISICCNGACEVKPWTVAFVFLNGKGLYLAYNKSLCFIIKRSHPWWNLLIFFFLLFYI